MIESPGWSAEVIEGPPTRMGSLIGEPPGIRSARMCRVIASAVVLGSSQPETLIGAARARSEGISVIRRASGGGAVLVDPGELVWVEVSIGRSDPLWDDDVGRATWWLGDVWSGALAGLGIDDVTVHHGALLRTRWSPALCFAGVGPGEVIAGGRKVVGISQRRTRSGARFECGALVGWKPDRLAGLLDLSKADRAEARQVLRATAAGLGDRGVRPADLEEAFLAALP